MRLLVPFFLAVLGLAACAHETDAVVVTHPPSEPAPSVEVPPSEPMPPAPSACNARLVTRATLEPSGVRLDALIENLTSETLVVALPDRCPAGLAVFEGLPGYDFYGACAMGACLAPAGPRAVVVPARGTVSIASAVLPDAGSACQPPLEPGAVDFAFTLPGAEGLRPCEVVSARVELRGRARTPTPPATPITTPSDPSPPPATTPRPRRDCPAIACGGCPGGYAPSRDGCPSCECLHGPSVMPGPPSRGPSPSP